MNNHQPTHEAGLKTEEITIKVPRGFKGNVNEISMNNLPEGARIVKLNPMSEDDKNEVDGLIINCITNAVQLCSINKQQEALDGREAAIREKEAKQQLENKRKAIMKFLSEDVLHTTVEILCNFIPQENLDKIKCDLTVKKCFIIDNVGMDCVIIPFLKADPVKEVDLTIFKDEIHGDALIKLFKALPETQVNKVVIAKVRQVIMTTEELTTMTLTKKSLASRGFTIVLRN